MGLLDLVIPTLDVEVSPGSAFAVRGLSPNDAMHLYYRHAGQLSSLFDQFAGKVKAGDEVSEGDVLAAGAQMISATPLLMAEIIALAADGDPSDVEGFAKVVSKAMDLNVGVQMDALQKIGAQTFSSDMPPGKFFGLVIEMARSAKAVLNQSAPKT